MRIIQTIPGLGHNLGGPSRTVTALSGHLSKIADSLALFTHGTQDELIVRPPCGDVDLRVIERPRGWDRFWCSSLRKELTGILNSRKQIIVHDNGIWLPFHHAVASVCRKFPAVVRVVSPRGMLEPWALGHSAWKKRIASLAYQGRDLASVTAFHATSDIEAANIRSLGFTQPIAIIPNAVTVPPSLPARKRRNGDRRQALFLSRIHPQKGLVDLVNAWGLIRPGGWRLLIVGGSQLGHRQEIELLIRARGLQDVISVAPEVGDEVKWGLYAESDLFVLPSYSENFGVVVAEAMLMSLPVITTNATPWSIISEQHCGWYINTGAAALKVALEQAFLMPAKELEAMGVRGNQLVRDRFDWSRIARQMHDFYEWLDRGGSSPSWIWHD